MRLHFVNLTRLYYCNKPAADQNSLVPNIAECAYAPAISLETPITIKLAAEYRSVASSVELVRDTGGAIP